MPGPPPNGRSSTCRCLPPRPIADVVYLYRRPDRHRSPASAGSDPNSPESISGNRVSTSIRMCCQVVYALTRSVLRWRLASALAAAPTGSASVAAASGGRFALCRLRLRQAGRRARIGNRFRLRKLLECRLLRGRMCPVRAVLLDQHRDSLGRLRADAQPIVDAIGLRAGLARRCLCTRGS